MHTYQIATDRKSNRPINIKGHAPRTIFVTGKRGTGKSYTLGRLANIIRARGVDVAYICQQALI